MSHADTEALVRNPLINYVNFTGSVEGGHQIQKAASDKFIGMFISLAQIQFTSLPAHYLLTLFLLYGTSCAPDLLIHSKDSQSSNPDLSFLPTQSISSLILTCLDSLFLPHNME